MPLSARANSIIIALACALLGMPVTAISAPPAAEPAANGVKPASFNAPLTAPGEPAGDGAQKSALARPGQAAHDAKGPTTTTASLITTGCSLAAALGLFLVMAWVLRRGATKSSGALPKEVFEVLGRAPLAARQQAHLVRCGNKLLLLCVMPTGVETLSEITDPAEVDRLLGICQPKRAASSTDSFRRVLNQLTGEPSAPPSAAAERFDGSRLTEHDRSPRGVISAERDHD